LLARLPDLPEAQRDTISMGLACRPIPADRRWFEWNRNTAAAAAALKAWPHPPCARRAKRPTAPPPIS
jgi:hypothetical protein